MRDKPKFVYVTYIRTTAEKLWDALTRPEFTKQYWAGTWQESDWRAFGCRRQWHGSILQPHDAIRCPVCRERCSVVLKLPRNLGSALVSGVLSWLSRI